MSARTATTPSPPPPMPSSRSDLTRLARPRPTAGWPSVAEHLADQRRRLLDEIVGAEPEARPAVAHAPPRSRTSST